MSPEPTKTVFDGEDDESFGSEQVGEATGVPREGTQVPADGSQHAVPVDTKGKPEPVEQEAEGSGKRDYVIFKEIDKDTFRKIAVVNHATSDGAIESLGEDGLEDGARYSAPPARYWNPKPAKVEKKTTITLG